MIERTLSLAGALERLEQAVREHPRCIVAFDADGTLWSDDVGNLAFDFALRENRIQKHASEALGRVLREFDGETPVPESPTARARCLCSAHQRGKVSDKLLAEIQVWAYAGLRVEEVEELAKTALLARPRRSVQKDAVLSLVEAARRAGARVVIVSASPEWIVAEAARELGFEGRDVIGGRAVIRHGFLEPELDGELPYGAGKINTLRERFGADPLVLATGDSGFDLHLLEAANLGLGIGRKPRLVAGIAKLSHCFLLEEI